HVTGVQTCALPISSREPVFFNGLEKERVFENAFLEYGSMESMTAPTGKKVFFLTDPIEDWPRTWDDYKRNYQATFTAQLLYPRDRKSTRLNSSHVKI